MPTYEELLLERQLCFALHAASRAVVREYAPHLAELGLTYPQYVTMLALWGDPDEPRTVGHLGAELQMDSGTLTPLLKRLEREGLVTRSRDTEDERRVHVRLTARGLALRDRARPVPHAVGARLGMTVEDGRALRDQLDRLLAALERAERRSGRHGAGDDPSDT